MCTAKQARLLELLGQELAIAEGAWERRRSHRDDALRRSKVRARLRYRSFFRLIAGDAIAGMYR